jgi:IclR family transcriptional regulator, acetate operon repressor
MTSKDQPLDRFFSVLGCVADAGQPLAITDIALALHLPLPTVHRLVAQLEERGLLKRPLGSKKVTVGFGLIALSEAAIGTALRDDEPHQILAALSDQIGEHCQIGQRSGNEIIYVDAVSAKRSQGLNFEHGVRSAMYCTSIGKLFLASMTPRLFDAWLDQVELKPVGPNTIDSPQRLRQIVDEVRRTQWAASNEEMAAGVVGCAVPIRDSGGRLLAGLGISVPSARVSFDELARFRPRMEAAAQAIAASLVG